MSLKFNLTNLKASLNNVASKKATKNEVTTGSQSQTKTTGTEKTNKASEAKLTASLEMTANYNKTLVKAEVSGKVKNSSTNIGTPKKPKCGNKLDNYSFKSATNVESGEFKGWQKQTYKNSNGNTKTVFINDNQNEKTACMIQEQGKVKLRDGSGDKVDGRINTYYDKNGNKLFHTEVTDKENGGKIIRKYDKNGDWEHTKHVNKDGSYMVYEENKNTITRTYYDKNGKQINVEKESKKGPTDITDSFDDERSVYESFDNIKQIKDYDESKETKVKNGDYKGWTKVELSNNNKHTQTVYINDNENEKTAYFIQEEGKVRKTGGGSEKTNGRINKFYDKNGKLLYTTEVIDKKDGGKKIMKYDANGKWEHTKHVKPEGDYYIYEKNNNTETRTFYDKNGNFEIKIEEIEEKNKKTEIRYNSKGEVEQKVVDGKLVYPKNGPMDITDWY